MKRTLLFLVFLLFGASAMAQSHRITGVVRDASGPVTGATVNVSGTTRVAVTSNTGTFSIEASPEQSLVVSFIGYITATVPVGERTVIDVTLETDATQIDELVVVGYGTMRRSDITGSIASVKSDELLVTPASNAGDMLRGRVAGVVVNTSSGRPGAAPEIVVRPKRQFGGSSTPLFVIDGTTADASEFNTLNPNDITSINVLKDAAAQAIYGARAANGVVLITTKRGQSGKPVVVFDAQVSLQTLQRNFDFYNAQEWYDLRRRALANDTDSWDYETMTPEQVLQDPIMEANYAAGRSTDWEKQMFETAVSQKYDLSIRGGTDKIKLSLGLGYVDTDGILKWNSHYQRGNIRANIDYDPYKWLSIGVNTSYMKALDEREDGNFNMFITRPPLGMPYDEDGVATAYINGVDVNPVFRMLHYKRQIITDNTRVTAFIDIKPFKGFNYRINASMFWRGTEDGTFKDSEYPAGGASSGALNNATRYRYLLDNVLSYTVPFRNKDHRLDATFVQSIDLTQTKEMNLGADSFPVDRDWNMISDAEITSKSRGFTENTVISFAGRMNYSFKDRYLISASIRRDGSNKFGPNNKWATFPAASVGWRISEEPFLKEVEAVSNLKLRVSYGSVGNQESIPSYRSIGLGTSYDYEFGDELIIGYLPDNVLPNPNLKWETITTANFGVDFSFFNDRLSGTVEYYDMSNTDMLVQRGINSALGYTSIWDNLGQLKTRGVELSLKGDIIRKKGLVWSAAVTFTKSKQEIVRVNNIKDENGKYVDDVDNRWFVGKPGNVYFDYEFDGIFQTDDFDVIDGSSFLKSTIDSDGDGIADKALEYPHVLKPGMIKVKDQNGDGKIDANDRRTFNRDNDWHFSFSTTLAWKGFDLFLDFYATGGAWLRNAYLYDYNSGGTLQGKLNGIKVDYWTPDNPSNRFQAPEFGSNATYASATGFQKTDYIRLRTVTLGYTVPARLTEKARISKLRVYATGTNLWTMTDVLSYGPEITTGAYPETRNWYFGLNVTF